MLFRYHIVLETREDFSHSMGTPMIESLVY